MGCRITAAVATTTLCFATGCGLQAEAPEVSTPATPTSSATTAEIAPYSPATADLRSLAQRFARAACAYDARTEDAHDFLVRVSTVATVEALDWLRLSQRAQLNWSSLKARAERVAITVTGVSRVHHADEIRLVVEFIRTTTTRFATVRSFDQLTLQVVDTPDGPKVADAHGAGL